MMKIWKNPEPSNMYGKNEQLQYVYQFRHYWSLMTNDGYSNEENKVTYRCDGQE